MRRGTKILLASGASLVLASGGAAWLLCTERGQATLLETALPMVPGLSYDAFEGHLFDLKFTNVAWEMPGLKLSANDLHLKLNRDALWEKRLVIDKLTAGHFRGTLVTSELPASEPDPEPKDNSPLTMPLPIELHGFEVADLGFDVDDIDIKLGYGAGEAVWVQDHLTVEPLTLRTLTVSLSKPLAKPNDQVNDQAKDQPNNAEVPDQAKATTVATQATTTDGFDVAPIRDSLREVLGKPLITSLPDVSIPFHITAKQILGTDLKLDADTPIVLDEVVLQGDMQGSDIALETLNVRAPQGSVDLTGKVALARTWPLEVHAKVRSNLAPLVGETADLLLGGNVLGKVTLATQTQGPIAATSLIVAEPSVPGLPLAVSLSSKNLTLPLDAKTKGESTKLSNVSLRMTGSAARWTLRSGVTVDAPQTPPATLALKAHGTLTNLDIDSLVAKTAGGTGTLVAKADWANDLTFDGDLKLSQLGVHHFVPSVKATLSGDTKIQGRLAPKSWMVDLPTLDIHGLLAKNPLSVQGTVSAQSPLKVNVPSLKVALGDNHLEGQGQIDGKILKGDLKIQAPNLANTLPGLSGRAEGFVTVGGTLTEPQIQADLTATKLAYDDMGLASLLLKGNVAAKPDGGIDGNLTLHASDAQLPGIDVRDLSARLDGTDKKHTLKVTLAGDPVSAGLELDGTFNTKTQAWSGVLKNGNVNTPVGDWAQVKDAALNIDAQKASATLAPHCWHGKDGDVCLTEPLVAADKGSAALAINGLDLRLVKPYLPSTTQLTGKLEADARAQWHLASGQLPKIDATLKGDNITVTQTVGEKSLPLHVDTLTLTAKTDAKTVDANVEIGVRHNGGIVGHARVTEPLTTRRLSGNLKIDPIDLSVLNALIATGEKATGTVKGDLRMAGTLAKPELYGDIQLANATVKEGAVPVVMKPSNLDVTFEGTRSTLKGQLETTNGTLNLSGRADWQNPNAPTAQVHAYGKDILITVPPYASVVVSPNVTFLATPTLMTLDGKIDVPTAKIAVSTLPETAVGVSSDEVMLDRHMVPKVKKTASIPIDSHLTVHIGDKVWIDAFGLKARLTGDLKVTQNRKRGLGLNGQVNVEDGRFHAYGQDLTVTQGQVLFSGAPDRPQLNIEAIRNPDSIEDNVTAGIRVTGNAQRPKVSVFSEPILSQQAALSYLLRGQGLSASTDDNAMLTSLLIGLGVSQTGSIVGAIGDAVGIRDLGIDTAGVGDSSQVVVSGYILPGLQLKYGVGIFDSLATITLRYRLLPRLYVEAISGVNQVFDVLYSFEF